jgi:hypothetical protein
MCEGRGQLLRSVEHMLNALPVDELTNEDAAEWVRFFTQLERLASYGTAICAGRVAETGHPEGATTPVSQWLADERGESAARGRTILKTAARLKELSATREAFKAGALSAAQATKVARAAALDPTAEQALLQTAYGGSVPGLHEQVQRIVDEAARPKDEAEAADRAKRANLRRYLHFWRDSDGGCRFSGRLTGEDGEHFRRTIEDESRRTLTIAAPRARLADALGQIVKERAHARRRTQSAAIVRVDVKALRRGHARDGEICEVPGVGPIDAKTALDLLGETMAYLLVTDGVDVAALCHLGDGLPLAMEIALEERDSACVVPGCREWQYLSLLRWRTEVPSGTPVTLGDFCRLCRHHRYYVDRLGFRVGGGPGAWELRAPETAEDGHRGGGGPRPPPQPRTE